MDAQETVYRTTGILYIVGTLSGEIALISLPVEDHEPLRALGLLDSEVSLSLSKAQYGSEYQDAPPVLTVRAKLYSIKMDGIFAKPQIELDQQAVRNALDRGMRDSDEVTLALRKIPGAAKAVAPRDPLPLELS